MKEQQAVQNFIEQVRWLYEPEYGDFKRKLGLYIQRLEEANPTLTKGANAKLLANMKQSVVYSPSGDIEATRKEVIQLAHQLLGTGSGALH